MPMAMVTETFVDVCKQCHYWHHVITDRVVSTCAINKMPASLPLNIIVDVLSVVI